MEIHRKNVEKENNFVGILYILLFFFVLSMFFSSMGWDLKYFGLQFHSKPIYGRRYSIESTWIKGILYLTFFFIFISGFINAFKRSDPPYDALEGLIKKLTAVVTVLGREEALGFSMGGGFQKTSMGYLTDRACHGKERPEWMRRYALNFLHREEQSKIYALCEALTGKKGNPALPPLEQISLWDREIHGFWEDAEYVFLELWKDKENHEDVVTWWKNRNNPEDNSGERVKKARVNALCTKILTLLQSLCYYENRDNCHSVKTSSSPPWISLHPVECCTESLRDIQSDAQETLEAFRFLSKSD